MLPLKFESPPVFVVMGWLPRESEEVVNVATPEPLSAPNPMGLPPSRKTTDPVGIPVLGGTGETVAVKVTDCPNTEGFAEEVTVVFVSALATSCGLPASAALLVLKLPSPP